MADENLIRERWQEFKAELRHVWDDLTNSDLEVADGDIDEVRRVLNRRYPGSPEIIEKKLNEFIAAFRRKHKEEEAEEVPAAHEERETVTGALRDQYRQF
jgi:hypothetical protein